MLGYLACLVQWGLFSQVYISFLPVCHTHEDVDQYFSKVAGYLRTHDAFDREGIVAAAKTYHPNWAGDDFEVHTDHVESAANISKWLNKKLTKFSCHIYFFQQYRIRRTRDSPPSLVCMGNQCLRQWTEVKIKMFLILCFGGVTLGCVSHIYDFWVKQST